MQFLEATGACVDVVTLLKQWWCKQKAHLAVYKKKNTNVNPQDGFLLTLVLVKSSDKDTKLNAYNGTFNTS